jgi:hypothetical protein
MLFSRYEIDVLEIGYTLGYKISDIAQTLGKTNKQVRNKAAKLGLKRPSKLWNKNERRN